MSPSKSKSRKNKKRQRRPAFRGKRYAIICCPYCDVSIYKRHLNIHINEFHADRSSNQTIRQHGAGIGGVNIADLSPDLQDEIKKRYRIDESGFIIPFETVKDDLLITKDDDEETD